MRRSGGTGNRQPRAAICALLLVALASTACRNGSDTPAAEGPAPDHVRAVVMPYLTFMPFHIAQQEGFFAQQNLEVEFVHLPRIQELMTGLARGDVDVAGGMLTTTVLNSIAGGARMRLVGALGNLPDNCAFSGVVARRELLDDGSLDDPDRLRRLTWDADLLIPYGYWLDRLTAPLGIALDDMTIVNLPEATAVESVLSGTIDVTLVSEPFLGRLQARPEDAVLWKSFGDIVPDYQISNVLYGPTILDDRPAVGERFAVAMLQGIRQYRQGKTPRNLEIVRAATGLGSEQVASACWPDAREDGRIPPGAFVAYQEWMVGRGLADRVLGEDEIIDTRFMDHANATLSR